MPTSRLQHFPLMVWGLQDGACRLGCGAPARFLLSTSSAWVFLFISSILRGCIRVFSRLANIFVLLAQGLERGSYEPDVTGSIPVWDMVQPFFVFSFLGRFPFPLLFRGFSQGVVLSQDPFFILRASIKGCPEG